MKTLYKEFHMVKEAGRLIKSTHTPSTDGSHL
jgi:hypothetical protein